MEAPPSTRFSEDMPFWRGLTTLDGKAYQKYIDSVLAPIEAVHGRIPRSKHYNEGHIKVGKRFYLHRRPIPSHEIRAHRDLLGFPWGSPCRQQVTLTMNRWGEVVGYVAWDCTVDIPIMCTSTETWMSVTPSEILSQRPGLRKARGNVLVGGMGMGWFARRTLERKQVKHVTVVDIDRDVLEFFGAPLLREFRGRIRLVHNDAYDIKPARFDSVLFDIWPGAGQSKYDDRWLRYSEGHPNVWGWM